jgi:hypothetical protein
MNLRRFLALSALLGLLSACSIDPPVRENLDEEPAPPRSAQASAPAGSVFEDEGSSRAYASGKTRHAAVSESFDDARSRPTLSDFDLLDEPHPRTICFSTKATEPNLMSEIVIRQMNVSFEGTPDYGPLFPGAADRVEQRLVIGKNNGWVNSQNLTNEKRQVFELNQSGNSLIIRINENKFGIYQDVGAPAEVWIRKDSRGYLFFKVFRVDAEHKRTEMFVGYCYKK